jgi:hypothetical protein
MSLDNERRFLDLIRRAVIPAGYRPETPEDIEAMLQACGDESITDEKLQRMLKKVKGELPIGERTAHEATDLSEFAHSLTEEQRELVALHKAQGTEMPPEILALLRKFRDEARLRGKSSPADGGADGGGGA